MSTAAAARHLGLRRRTLCRFIDGGSRASRPPFLEHCRRGLLGGLVGRVRDVSALGTWWWRADLNGGGGRTGSAVGPSGPKVQLHRLLPVRYRTGRNRTARADISLRATWPRTLEWSGILDVVHLGNMDAAEYRVPPSDTTQLRVLETALGETHVERRRNGCRRQGSGVASAQFELPEGRQRPGFRGSVHRATGAVQRRGRPGVDGDQRVHSVDGEARPTGTATTVPTGAAGTTPAAVAAAVGAAARSAGATCASDPSETADAAKATAAAVTRGDRRTGDRRTRTCRGRADDQHAEGGTAAPSACRGCSGGTTGAAAATTIAGPAIEPNRSRLTAAAPAAAPTTGVTVRSGAPGHGGPEAAGDGTAAATGAATACCSGTAVPTVVAVACERPTAPAAPAGEAAARNRRAVPAVVAARAGVTVAGLLCARAAGAAVEPERAGTADAAQRSSGGADDRRGGRAVGTVRTVRAIGAVRAGGSVAGFDRHGVEGQARGGHGLDPVGGEAGRGCGAGLDVEGLQGGRVSRGYVELPRR